VGPVWDGLALASSHSPSISDIEDSGGMLQPIQVSRDLLDNVTLASCREADHDDDQLGTDISLGYATIGRDLGTSEAGDIEGCGTEFGCG